MHVIYMYVRRAIRAADPADSHVQARSAPKTAGRSTSGRRVPSSGNDRASTTQPDPPAGRCAQAHNRRSQQAPYTCRIPVMDPPCTSRRPVPGSAANHRHPLYQTQTQSTRPLALPAGPAGSLDELRVLLLHPAIGARARTGDPAWVIGLTGIALPGLRRAVASLASAYRGDPADLQTEVLTGFLAALRGLALDDLEFVPLASRLCWAASRAGQAWLTPTPTTRPAVGWPSGVTVRTCPGGSRISCWPPLCGAGS